MNKLASIYFLQQLGLPTINPRLIRSKTEQDMRREVDSFFTPQSLGWVLRCGGLPDERANVERGLPWTTAKDKEELIQKILQFQKAAGPKYSVFCHPAFELVRGGTMLIEGDKVTIEAAAGDADELSAMFRGRRSPEQTLEFKPGMLSHSCSGRPVLTINDLHDARRIERMLSWTDLRAIVDPVSVEFSRRSNGRLYVHDVSVLR